MRKLNVLIAVVAMAGCARASPRNEEQIALEAHVAKEKEARAEAQRLWTGLIRDGQGCSGRALRDGELQKVVVGNRIANTRMVRSHSSDGPIVSRSYYPNGRLESTVEFADPYGRYWVADQKLCHWNLHGMGDVTWCLRLIQSPDGQIMEEFIDDRDPSQLRLACVPIKIEKLEGES